MTIESSTYYWLICCGVFYERMVRGNIQQRWLSYLISAVLWPVTLGQIIARTFIGYKP